jgi:hypothetical protein
MDSHERMLLNMLKAISTMLICESKNEVEFSARVRSAKIMLDEIIKGLEPYSPISPVYDTPVVPVPVPVPKKERKLKPGEYKVIVDDNKKILRIEGLPLDGKIDIDGKIMTHQEAVGRTFTTARIL